VRARVELKTGISKGGERMNNKSSKVINSLVALGVVVSALPAYADETPLARALKHYEEISKKQGASIQASQLAKLEKELKALEADEKLDRNGILSTAMIFQRLAQKHAPSLNFRGSRMVPQVQVVADDAPAKDGNIKQKNYNAAEGYRLRAMALYNRLPETDPTRINEQRNLASWFYHYGQKQQEELQTQQLSKLLHTTDRDKLCVEWVR
jgi:hypothetical protein